MQTKSTNVSQMTWYWCPEHSTPSDPQEQEMLADVYGWQRVSCPHEKHSKKFNGANNPIDAGELLLFAILCLLVAFLLTGLFCPVAPVAYTKKT